MHNNNLTYADVDSLVKKYIQFFPDAHKKLLKSFSAEEKQRFFKVKHRQLSTKNSIEKTLKHYNIVNTLYPYTVMQIFKIQTLYKRKKLCYRAIVEYLRKRYPKQYQQFTVKIVKNYTEIGFLKCKQFLSQKKIFNEIRGLQKQLHKQFIPAQVVKDIYKHSKNWDKTKTFHKKCCEIRQKIFEEHGLTCNVKHICRSNAYKKTVNNEATNKKILNLKEKLKLLQAKHKKELRAYTIRKYVV